MTAAARRIVRDKARGELASTPNALMCAAWRRSRGGWLARNGRPWMRLHCEAIVILDYGYSFRAYDLVAVVEPVRKGAFRAMPGDVIGVGGRFWTVGEVVAGSRKVSPFLARVHLTTRATFDPLKEQT
jgi:hypothetical protein